MPYGEVDRLSKLIPANPADPWDLERALEGVPELTAAIGNDPRIARLIGIARTLEGRPRHSSTHAAGVVIGDRPLVELVPLLRDPKSDFPVTQFDLKSAEDAGLVKFDFLGLRTLSVLDRAVKLLAAEGVAIDLARLPLEDPETFALLTRGETVGVFQFESEGMRRALAQVRPDRFEDLVALDALFRPGPMDNIPSFAARKWGREPVDFLHPSLEPILKPTYGIIIYQEQVMQIAQVLAGYSLGEADLLRRAMGKKIKAEMDAQEARFVEGAVAKGVARERASFIFRLVEKFAGYGFNRSHAAAYALVAWQTAWLKAHHPAAFYAATMAFDMGDTDKLKLLAGDMRRAGVALLPPCVNASGADFALERVEGELAVRYALGALKGVGVAAMEAMVAERVRAGAFRSLDDWAGRVDPRALNRRQVEALAASGAFDALGPRAAIFAGAEALLAAAQGAARAREEGQGGLFGGPAGAAMAVPLPAAAPWRPGERLAREREAFGLYFSGHPVDAHAVVLEAHGVQPSSAVAERRGGPGDGRVASTMAGLVDEIRWRTPQGAGAERRFLLVDASDGAGPWNASCFAPELHPLLIEAAGSGEPFLFQVELSWREADEGPRIAITGARPLLAAARGLRLRLVVRLAAGLPAGAVLARLRAVPRGGRSDIEVEVPAAGLLARLRLGRDFQLTAETEADLALLPGVATAAIEAASAPLRLVA
jgi:DNA polymerase-3 subunit alpha